MVPAKEIHVNVRVEQGSVDELDRMNDAADTMRVELEIGQSVDFTVFEDVAMRQRLLLVDRLARVPVVDPLDRQVRSEMGMRPAHRRYEDLGTIAPAVIHGLDAVDLVLAPLPLEGSLELTGQIEVTAIAGTHAGAGVLLLDRGLGHRAVLGVVDIEGLHQPLEVELDFGVVITAIFHAVVANVVRLDVKPVRGLVLGQLRRARQGHLRIQVKRFGTVVDQRSVQRNVTGLHADTPARHGVDHPHQLFLGDVEAEPVGFCMPVVGIRGRVEFGVLRLDQDFPPVIGMAAYEFRSMLGSTPAAICRNRTVRLLKTC